MIENNEYDYDTYLSFKDLELIDGWRDVLVSGATKKLEEILHTNGCDLEFGYALMSQKHTPRVATRVEHFGPLIRYRERRDKEFEKYRTVEDIGRTHESSTVRYGMNMSLNTGMYLGQIIEDQFATHKKYLENLKAAEEACECKENKGK